MTEQNEALLDAFVDAMDDGDPGKMRYAKPPSLRKGGLVGQGTGGHSMRFQDDEPPTMCGRLDCRVQSLGRVSNAHAQVDYFDKAGNPIPNPDARSSETRHCVACGATWTIEVKP